jgi:hypothetical protein
MRAAIPIVVFAAALSGLGVWIARRRGAPLGGKLNRPGAPPIRKRSDLIVDLVAIALVLAGTVFVMRYDLSQPQSVSVGLFVLVVFALYLGQVNKRMRRR